MIAESRLIGHNFLLSLLVVMTTMVELTSAWHSMKANVKLALSPGPSLLWPRPQAPPSYGHGVSVIPIL